MFFVIVQIGEADFAAVGCGDGGVQWPVGVAYVLTMSSRSMLLPSSPAARP